jgi:hypothetical protein
MTRNGRGGLFTCVFVDDLVEALGASHAGEVCEVGLVEARVERARERLAASNQGPPSPPTVPRAVVAVFLLGVVLDVCLHNLLDIANLDQDVLGLQVGVDDAALAVQVVEAEQHLLGDLLDQRHGDAAVVPPLYQPQQVLAQHFKDHAHVHAVGALVVERVEQADDVGAAGMVLIRVDNLLQQLDLVEGRLCVVRSGAHDLERDVLAVAVVARQPDGGEVAPAELAHNGVLAVFVLLAHLHRVVAALAVVLRVLLVGRVLCLVDRRRRRVGRVAQLAPIHLVLVEGRGRVLDTAGSSVCNKRAVSTCHGRRGTHCARQYLRGGRVCGRADVLVLEAARRRGRGVLAGLLLGGDDGLQVLPLPPLLAAVAVRGLRDLLGLVDGGLLDVGAIHGVFPATRWAAACDCARDGLRVRSGAAVAACWAHGRGAEVEVKGSQAGATRRMAVVALRSDFFNCWSIGLALPSPACRLRAPDWRDRGVFARMHCAET